MNNIVVLCTAYEHCPLQWLIKKKTPCKCCTSFFMNLTTLNDEIIDKDSLLNLILYQVTYGLYFLIVLTANCRR